MFLKDILFFNKKQKRQQKSFAISFFFSFPNNIPHQEIDHHVPVQALRLIFQLIERNIFRKNNIFVFIYTHIFLINKYFRHIPTVFFHGKLIILFLFISFFHSRLVVFLLMSNHSFC